MTFSLTRDWWLFKSPNVRTSRFQRFDFFDPFLRAKFLKLIAPDQAISYGTMREAFRRDL